MWKVSNSYVTDDNMNILLVDIEDEERWTKVDKITYQVLEDMGLIHTGIDERKDLKDESV